jgi:hypothetical protein
MHAPRQTRERQNAPNRPTIPKIKSINEKAACRRL